MTSRCIFCRIANKEIAARIVYEDETVVAFRDVNPQAPVHILVIPRHHIPTLNDLDDQDKELIAHLILTASRIAKEEDISESGYRLILNCNRNAGQSVFHIHLHLLGGRSLLWPPG